MKHRLHFFVRAALSCILLNAASFASAWAQGTAFTYQGRLSSATNPVTGSYDLQFSIYSASSGGSPTAGPVTNSAVNVSNGLFTTIVSFPGNPFTGGSNWLEIAVSTNGANTFTNLVPRQQLTPTPYAVYAQSANASNLVGTIPPGNLSGAALLAGGNAFTGNQTISGGSVGIGTPSPAKALDVTGTASGVAAGSSIESSVFMRVNNSASDGSGSSPDFAGIGFGRNSTRQAIVGGTFGNDYLDFYTGGLLTSPKMRIDFGGNVGIGTATIGARLQVQGSGTVSLFAGNLTPFGVAGFETAFASPQTHIWCAEGVGKTNVFNVSAGGSAYFAGNVSIGGSVGIATNNTLQLGAGLSGQEPNAGKIGYETFTSDSLDIVGAGTNDTIRKIKFWAEGGANFNGNLGIGTTTPETTVQVGSYSATDTYLTVSTAGANRYRAGIDLRHFNSGYGWTLLSDERDNSFRLLSHFNDTNGITRMFVDRFSGNVGIGTTNPAAALDVAGEINCTAINITSDRNAKEDFQTVNPREVLAKVAALPITEWQYKADKANDAASRHLGPMAQDFTAAFALGNDDKHISMVDEGGVALAAIQGLNEKVDERDARLREQERKIQSQAGEIRRLSQALAELQSAVSQMQRNVAKSKAE